MTPAFLKPPVGWEDHPQKAWPPRAPDTFQRTTVKPALSRCPGQGCSHQREHSSELPGQTGRAGASPVPLLLYTGPSGRCLPAPAWLQVSGRSTELLKPQLELWLCMHEPAEALCTVPIFLSLSFPICELTPRTLPYWAVLLLP